MINKKVIIAFFIICLISAIGFKTLFSSIAIIPTRLFSSNCSQATYFFNTEKKLIALAIDNVPDNNHVFPNTTLGMLDVLANYKAKATFFINIDKAKEFPALMISIVEQGHELGNYLTNNKLSIGLGYRFKTKLAEADRFLSQFAAINWFRAERDRCSSNLNRVIKIYGYKIALGSVWSDDINVASSQSYNRYIKKNIRPGAIIVLHDSNNQSDRLGENTIAVLNQIIPQLQQQGYSFVTLSELDRRSHS